MASHPSFDPAQLDEEWPELIARQDAPLLNRASLGQYPPGNSLGPLLLAAAIQSGSLPDLPGAIPDLSLEGCTSQPGEISWPQLVSHGCPAPVSELSQILGPQAVEELYTDLGLFESPALLMPSAGTPLTSGDGGVESFLVSPLQMAMAISSLNGRGVVPAARIATAYRGSDGKWTGIPPEGSPREVFDPLTATATSAMLAAEDRPYWETLAGTETADGENLTWYLAGTEASWQGAPLNLVLILEEEDPAAAERIGRALMDFSLE
jgi:peptidoglycan glycosyltransferase